MQTKREVVEALLNFGEVHVTLDARQPGVQVPALLSGDPALVLKFSYRHEPGDLAVNEWGMRAMLSFNRQPFACAVPWGAIHAVESHVTGDGLAFAKPDEPPAVERERGGLQLLH
jgi:stringent starvation protein B